MKVLLQILWMMVKVSLFGLALLVMFGGGLCGAILTLSGGMGDPSGVAWGIGLIVLAIISGFVASAISKTFKKKTSHRPSSDDRGGWGNP